MALSVYVGHACTRMRTPSARARAQYTYPYYTGARAAHALLLHGRVRTPRTPSAQARARAHTYSPASVNDEATEELARGDSGPEMRSGTGNGC